MIDPTHDLSIKRQAQLAGISWGTVSYPAATRQPGRSGLDAPGIDVLHLEHPFMGTRMLRDMLNRQRDAQGRTYATLGRNHATTLMRRIGISDLYRKPGTSGKHPDHIIYPYLLLGMKIERVTRS